MGDQLLHRNTDCLCTLEEVKGGCVVTQGVNPGTDRGDFLCADIKVRVDGCIAAIDKEA